MIWTYRESWVLVFFVAHLGLFRNALYPSRSVAEAVVALMTAISFRSLSTLFFQVVRGLSGLLLPCGVQVSAVLAMLLPSRTCSIHLHHRSTCTASPSPGPPVQFLMWDLVWPENSLYLSRAFPVRSIDCFHVCGSCDSPYHYTHLSRMATTLVLKMCSFVSELYFDYFHRGWSVAKATLARARLRLHRRS